MSAKARFLQKLQNAQPQTDNYATKGLADMDTFRQRLGMLRESIETWLTGTGIHIIDSHCTVTEMLISNGAFQVPCFALHYENRIVKFTPVFLYGQGVTGCVEVALVVAGQADVLCRLFMRSTEHSDWTYVFVSNSAGQRVAFSEDEFFVVIDPLLP